MAENKYSHEIEWDEKVYFNSTTSTSYGHPVQAMYEVDENGKPLAKYLTKEGREHFGVKDPEELNAKGKNKKDKEVENGKEKEGCLTKLLKAPFRLLWWLIKKALIILSLGILSSWLNSDD